MKRFAMLGTTVVFSGAALAVIVLALAIYVFHRAGLASALGSVLSR
jgi:hypothetical protein